MNIRSLRLRLLAGAAIAILASLAAAWLVMSILFQRHLERREIEELDRQAIPLIAGLQVDAKGALSLTTQPSDPRFARAGSGLYWQVTSQYGRLRSRSLWDQELKTGSGHDGKYSWQSRSEHGPFEPEILLLERRLTIAGGHQVIVQLAEDQKSVRAARAEFGFELFLFLGALWLVLSGAAALQVQLGLKPLERLRDALRALRLNPSERLAVAQHPPEVEPLTCAINQLAETREQDLARARRRSADLAHGLKTPLSVLAAESRKLRARGDADMADGLDRAIAAAGAAIEAELARAKAAAARQSVSPEAVPARLVAERVVSVVEHTEAGAKLAFAVDVPDTLTVPGSAEELSEIIGALTENAARYARRQVRIAGDKNEECLQLRVEDDGPGLEDWRAEQALVRGQRLDETGSGHGLGLSIARDLVEARGGSIALKRSKLGGLEVEMLWPLA
ncbi:MAG TPA: HAMP domain-containing sensor histidine kinase [Rhizomicrobium sp.]|nr:HAMP domain-containing sensor histidine kinase [Rhizomicrobium sp.]